MKRWTHIRTSVARISLCALVLLGVLPDTGRTTTFAAAATGMPTQPFSAGSQQSGEVIALRTRTSQTFAEHGHFRTEISAASLNYQDAGGAWQPIDNTLVASTDSNYAYQNAANRYTVRLPASLASGPVQVATSAGWLTFGLIGGSGTGAVSGNTDTFGLSNGTVSYAATSDALKESITLNGPPSPSSFTYTVRASAGLSLQANAAGGIDVRSAGAIVLALAPPTMVDAAGVTSDAVHMTVTPSGTGWTLAVSADAAWLADAARSWPVVIDPTVVLQPTSQGCYLDSQYPNTSYCNPLLLDLDHWGSTQQRALVQFALPQAIPSTAQILSADLALRLHATTNTTAKEVDVYQVTRSWTTMTTWNTYDGANPWTVPGGDTASTAAAVNTSVGPTLNTWYHWYPTGLVQGWINGSIPNDGMLLQEALSSSQAELYFDNSASAPPNLTITWAPELGFHPWQPAVGGVNVVNGNLALGGTDMSMGGVGLPLAVGRTFNGLSTRSSDFGNRWVMDGGADVGLQVAADGSVLLNAPDGSQAVFRVSNGSLVAPPGLDATLVKNGDGSYALTANAGGEKLTFTSGGVLTSEATRTGNTLSYSYTGGLLSSIRDTLGQTTTFTYASPVSATLISQMTDAAGRVYQYGYDANKNLTSYTDPSGKVEQYGYDAGGNLIALTDPNGNQTTIGYDTSGRVTSITDPINASTGTHPVTTFTYNSGTTVVTDPTNHAWTYSYDLQGRVTGVQDPNNHTGLTSWNTNNQVTSVKAPSGATTSYTYSTDGFNNLTKVTLPNGAAVSAGYGNSTLPYDPTTVTDAQGNTSSVTYNSTGTVASSTDGTNHSASFTYNSNGTVNTSTDENGHVTSYSYATNGLPQQDTPPCPNGVAPPCAASPTPLGTTVYTFNSYNLESTVTDGKGQLTTYTYDADGRVTGIGYAGGNHVGYAYDANGNLTAMTDSTGTTSYAYDALNQLTSETKPTGTTLTCPGTSIVATVCYQYDTTGNLTAKRDSAGTVAYSYDPAGQVTGVTDRTGGVYTVGYDQDGNRTSVGFPNGITEAMTYDPAGQLTKSTGTKGTSTRTSYSYSYTNPTTNAMTTVPYSVTDLAGKTTSYTYDGNNALTQALQKDSGGATLNTYGYGYDPAGNLTTKTTNGTSTTFSYNAVNELTGATGGMTRTYSYDGNGDLLSSSDGTSISLNTAGQITSITPPAGSAIPYTYTGIGEQQRTGNGTTKSQYDGTGVGQQIDGSGNVTTFTTLPDGTLLSEAIPAGTSPCPSGGNPCSYYYLSDGAGSVAAVTDSTGNVKNTYSYDPLGNTTSTGTVPNPFTFHGWQYDSQTHFYYTGSDYYDPATGQHFGCKDSKRNEDRCGEDEVYKLGPTVHEAPSIEHGNYPATFQLYGEPDGRGYEKFWVVVHTDTPSRAYLYRFAVQCGNNGCRLGPADSNYFNMIPGVTPYGGVVGTFTLPIGTHYVGCATTTFQLMVVITEFGAQGTSISSTIRGTVRPDCDKS